MCVKCRKKILTSSLDERLKAVVEEIAGKFGIQIIEQETEQKKVLAKTPKTRISVLCLFFPIYQSRYIFILLFAISTENQEWH